MCLNVIRSPLIHVCTCCFQGALNSSQSADGEGELITGDVDTVEFKVEPVDSPAMTEEKPLLIHVVNGQQNASEPVKLVPAGPSATVSFLSLQTPFLTFTVLN